MLDSKRMAQLMYGNSFEIEGVAPLFVADFPSFRSVDDDVPGDATAANVFGKIGLGDPTAISVDPLEGKID